jgi:predicted PurR-regulated permease PerM
MRPSNPSSRECSSRPRPRSVEIEALQSSSLSLNVLRLAFLGLLLYGAAVLLYPFSSVILWSIALSVSLYPVYAWIAERLNGRRRFAAFIVTALTLLILTLPAAWIAITLAESLSRIYEQMDFSSIAFLSPPESIKTWPLIGDELYRLWAFAVGNVGEIVVKLGPQIKSVASSFLRISAGAGLGTVSFVLAIIVMGFLLPASASIAGYVRGFARKLDPVRGEHFVELASATIRAVARGVVGISVLQAIFASVGFVGGGIPQASLLTFAVLIFGIVQIGAAIVIIPVIVWSWTFMSAGPAVVFTIYMLAVSAMDNILKPFVMGRGLEAPMLAILVGVIGGALAFGISGVFLGPIILTVLWTLFVAWIDEPQTASLQ